MPRGHERNVSNIRLVPGAVNSDRTLDHRVFADSAERSAASTPAGRAGRTVGAPAESVDAAEHRMKIPNAMGEWSAGNQEERSAVWFVVAALLPVDADGDSHAHRRWPFFHDQWLKFPLADCVHDRAVE